MTPQLVEGAAVTAITSPMTEPWILQWHPNESLHLRLSVDARHNGGHPINRDYDLPAFSANGQTLTDQRVMRQGIVMTAAQHCVALGTHYPGEQLLAYVGNGNLEANYGFVAWAEGHLYALADEPVFKHAYASLASWTNGQITVEDLFFARENGGVTVLRSAEGTIHDITAAITLATSGQALVRHGEVIPLEQIADQWYDTRHVVSPLLIPINGTALFVPNAQFQQGLLRKALRQPVHIRLEAVVDTETVLPLSTAGWMQLGKDTLAARGTVTTFLQEHGLLNGETGLEQADVLLRMVETTEQLLTQALQGYRLVDTTRPLREEEARFINGHLEIFFKKALYPHNIFVRWADGSCGFVVFPGKSGREGTTLPAAQQFLQEELKVQDALLLDNGGDTRLWYRGQHLVPSSEGRDEIRALLALTVPTVGWSGGDVMVW
ncbi:MAG: phosphodiester glycosidase family protein [Candidatus Binatia bacterium]